MPHEENSTPICKKNAVLAGYAQIASKAWGVNKVMRLSKNRRLFKTTNILNTFGG
jgi:hypothetical protein